MTKKMAHLVFPQRLIKKPVIYTMAKKYDVIPRYSKSKGYGKGWRGYLGVKWHKGKPRESKEVPGKNRGKIPTRGRRYSRVKYLQFI